MELNTNPVLGNTELPTGEGQVKKETSGDKPLDAKSYSQDEMNALLQKESDRRVSTALDKQKKDYEKKLSLVNLDETQRAAAEKDMRIQDLQEQVKLYNVEKNKSELKSVLGSRGLSPQFADLIEIGDDIGEAQDRINTLDKLFKAAVSDEVKKRLATGAPKSGTVTTGEQTKDTVKKMTVAQKTELYQRDPEAFKKLTNN